MNTVVEMTLLAEAEFPEYKKKWNDLLEKSDLTSFFLKWEWLYSFWVSVQHMYNDSKLRIYVFKAGTELVGLLPLYLQNSTNNVFPIRSLRFLGDQVASDHMDIICLPGYSITCCSLFYDNVILKGKNNFDKIEFQSLRKGSNLLTYLKKRENKSFLEETICPRIILPQTYEEYLKRYKSKRRNQIRKRAEKIHKKFKSVKIEFHTSKAELMNTLFRLHKKRSNAARNGRSSFCNEFREKFNYNLYYYCDNSSEDILYSIVKINDEIVSILYMFVYKGNLYYYQNGWLPEYTDYSIGMFHLYEVIKYAIEKGYSTFDMLRGDEPYKYRLKGEELKTLTFIYFSQSFLGSLHRYLYSFSKGITLVVKKYLLMV